MEYSEHLDVMSRHGSSGESPLMSRAETKSKDTISEISTCAADEDDVLNASSGSGSMIKTSISSPSFPGALQRHRSSSESKLFMSPTEKSSGGTPSKQSKRESLKAQKRNYRSQKKEATRELLSALKDSSVIVLADWLKVRGTLKSWSKLWCVLKPGLLVLYKSEKQKSSHWVGTVLLNTCRLIERPSKKDGFCFKLFHPLDQSIWATKGPKGETMGAIVQPLPYSYLIFRAMSESAGKCWMDALDLALRCKGLLMKSMKKEPVTVDDSVITEQQETLSTSSLNCQQEELNDSDCEKHFAGQGLEEDSKTDKEEIKTDTDTETEEDDPEKEGSSVLLRQPDETPYVENKVEELGQQGDACQTEEVNEENKSLIWTLVKQVRPGMDLSKVVLPTFILEPRSFLDKLSDYYYHADILSEAVLLEDPYERIKRVVKWYLSGFYKKPKGLKKPYNPIIGETFRCYWRHPKTDSRTFYIAEQISHHPPITAFHITNRHDGFNISGSILAKSKFYGNSLSAILDGTAKLTFLMRGEDYYITMPYAHCKGILIGTLTMEMGGKVSIDCPKTGYKCDLDFKLKPFLGSGEASNKIAGKLKMGTDVLATLDGHWDAEVYIKDKATKRSDLFWNPTTEVKKQRLHRYTIPIEAQNEMDSERLWKNVSEAVVSSDMHVATEEKHILEERQRKEARERKAKMEEWVPKLFDRDLLTGEWLYKHLDMRPWDTSNDLLQYECDYAIKTWTKHRTPVVRTHSIPSLEQQPVSPATSRISCLQRASFKRLRVVGEESESSAHEMETKQESDSSECQKARKSQRSMSLNRNRITEESLLNMLQPVIDQQKEINQSLSVLQRQMSQLTNQRGQDLSYSRDFIIVIAVIICQIILQIIWR